MSGLVLEMDEKDKTGEHEETNCNIDKENKILLNNRSTENVCDIDDNNKTRDENECLMINVDNLNQKSVIGVSNREYSAYSYYGAGPNKTKLPVTIVQFVGNIPGVGKPIPPSDGEPLNYDPSTRNSFVKLVFSIVLIMLLSTAGFNVLVYTNEVLASVFLEYNLILMICSCIALVSLSYAVACSECTRSIPCNFIILILSVIAMSVLSSCVTIRYRTELIFYAFITTAVVVMICIALACTSFDFTKFLLYVVVILAVIGVLTIIMAIVRLTTGVYIKPLHMVILFVGALIQSVLLIIELQMILGGKTVELSENDYAMGAFMLYSSIMDLFLKILMLIAGIDTD